MKSAAAIAVCAGLLLLPASRASAQTDFSGTWALDRDLSADLSKATFDPPAPPKPRSTGMSGGLGGFGFGGRMGGGGNRGGGSRPSGGSGENGSRGTTALTVDEKARLHEFADYVRTLAPVVTIEHTDHSTFTVTDNQGHSRLFPTDGSKIPQTLTTVSVDSTTRWDGPHMVTTYALSTAHDLVFTYILVPATKQMALRIRLDENGRPRTDLPELRLVYKLKS